MHYLVCLTRVSLLLPAANLLDLEIDLQVNQRIPSPKAQSVSHAHIFHDLDALRFRAICMAEDTSPGTHLGWDCQPGQGQVQQCRGWDKLVAWVNDPSRHACYASVDEYGDAAHEVECLAFCQNGSAFRLAMVSWVVEHGHKTMFE